MYDELGRNIRYLRLSVTDRCNCRCLYCMPAHGISMLRHEDILSFEEMCAIVEASAQLGVRKVRLTGGEPLARRGIVDLVRMVSAVEGIEEVVMTTNATLLAPLAKDLKAAGLSRLNISLDTLDSELYTKLSRTGTFDDALAGIEAAREAGFIHTKFNTVLLGGLNESEIRPLAERAKSEPIDVRFIELMRMGECSKWPAERFISADCVLKVLPELEAVGSNGVTELFQAPGWRGRVGLIRPMTHTFCSSCDRIRVTADGMLKPCLHSAREIPLRGLVGDELVQVLRQGISKKPEGHIMSLSHASESLRAMNKIGG